MAIDPKVLKQVRVALGLSQQELADALHVSRVTVNKMERGKLARGIPDAIGDRLMALKSKPVAKGPRDPEKHGFTNGLWRLEERDAARAKALAKSDNHLWDNEEDDQ